MSVGTATYARSRLQVVGKLVYNTQGGEKTNLQGLLKSLCLCYQKYKH